MADRERNDPVEGGVRTDRSDMQMQAEEVADFCRSRCDKFGLVVEIVMHGTADPKYFLRPEPRV
jgi:hypothetical protein